jgi:hypothetical protein
MRHTRNHSLTRSLLQKRFESTSAKRRYRRFKTKLVALLVLWFNENGTNSFFFIYALRQSAQQMYFFSRYSSMPYREPCRIKWSFNCHAPVPVFLRLFKIRPLAFYREAIVIDKSVTTVCRFRAWELSHALISFDLSTQHSAFRVLQCFGIQTKLHGY